MQPLGAGWNHYVVCDPRARWKQTLPGSWARLFQDPEQERLCQPWVEPRRPPGLRQRRSSLPSPPTRLGSQEPTPRHSARQSLPRASVPRYLSLCLFSFLEPEPVSARLLATHLPSPLLRALRAAPAPRASAFLAQGPPPPPAPNPHWAPPLCHACTQKAHCVYN